DARVVLLDERDGAFARAGDIVADVDIRAVVGRLAERLIPGVKMGLRVRVVASPNFPLGRILANALAGRGVTREFHRELVRAQRLADVEGVLVLGIRTVQAKV